MFWFINHNISICLACTSLLFYDDRLDGGGGGGGGGGVFVMDELFQRERKRNKVPVALKFKLDRLS
jgi:hypothetical protein